MNKDIIEYKISVEATSDAFFIGKLLSIYEQVELNSEKEKKKPIQHYYLLNFDFSDLYSWISANTLSFFLLFIEQITRKIDLYNIKIKLFSEEIDDKIFHHNSDLTEELLNKFASKLRFYNRWHFPYQIYRIKNKVNKKGLPFRSINCFPSKTPILTWVEALNEIVGGPSFETEENDSDKISSTLLPISIIEKEKSKSYIKKNVDLKINNLCNILWMHIYGNKKYAHPSEVIKEHRKAEKVSNNILYELVKNIYQHSEAGNKKGNVGFITVQILKKSILYARNNTSYPNSDTNRPIRKAEIADALGFDYSSEQEVENNVRYLAISILDRGQGLHTSVLNHIKAESGGASNDLTEEQLIEKAIFSNFTTKKIKKKLPEFICADDQVIQLSPRGYGWIYCLLFIAARLGSFNVSSGKTSITYRTKVEGYREIVSLRGKFGAFRRAEELFAAPGKIFEKIPKLDSPSFVGTRVLIEMPINYKWFEREKEYKEEDQSRLHRYMEELIGSDTRVQ